MSARGIKVLEVGAGSVADEIGLEPGDQILAINDREVPDELALKFYLSEEFADLCVRRSNGIEEHLQADLSSRTELGIKVEEFRTLTCNNACLFCFIDQLPPGIRPSLRVKDDDYRLSFLHGNYITMTNLNERDLDRIIEQRLSPLYVSVHATDPDLRTRMLGRKKADNLGAKLGKLVRGGIQLHAQIVLMPKINDGLSLEKTIFDLRRLYPGIQSVAIVPVGLSDHGNAKDLFMPFTPGYSRELIRRAIRWQERFRARIGRTFAYLADEFYIQGGVEIPQRSYYDDFAQIEDGVGMVREFLDAFETELSRRRRFRAALEGTLATGRLFFPVLKRCVRRLNRKFGVGLKVCQIENRFLGGNITVAGLLAGQDILAALRGKDLGDFLIIPNEALSRTDGILVDNFSVKELSKSLGTPVYPGGRTVNEFFQVLSKIGSRNRERSRCRFRPPSS
jgi:putative radical SAM enzyme (TIGR03279 family)